MRVPVSPADLASGEFTRNARRLVKAWPGQGLSLMQAQNHLAVMCGYRSLHDLQRSGAMVSPVRFAKRKAITAALALNAAKHLGVGLSDAFKVAKVVVVEGMSIDAHTAEGAFRSEEGEIQLKMVRDLRTAMDLSTQARGANTTKRLVFDEAWSGALREQWFSSTPRLLELGAPAQEFIVRPNGKVFVWELLEQYAREMDALLFEPTAEAECRALLQEVILPQCEVAPIEAVRYYGVTYADHRIAAVYSDKGLEGHVIACNDLEAAIPRLYPNLLEAELGMADLLQGRIAQQAPPNASRSQAPEAKLLNVSVDGLPGGLSFLPGNPLSGFEFSESGLTYATGSIWMVAEDITGWLTKEERKRTSREVDALESEIMKVDLLSRDMVGAPVWAKKVADAALRAHKAKAESARRRLLTEPHDPVAWLASLDGQIDWVEFDRLGEARLSEYESGCDGDPGIHQEVQADVARMVGAGQAFMALYPGLPAGPRAAGYVLHRLEQGALGREAHRYLDAEPLMRGGEPAAFLLSRFYALVMLLTLGRDIDSGEIDTDSLDLTMIMCLSSQGNGIWFKQMYESVDHVRRQAEVQLWRLAKVARYREMLIERSRLCRGVGAIHVGDKVPERSPTEEMMRLCRSSSSKLLVAQQQLPDFVPPGTRS